MTQSVDEIVAKLSRHMGHSAEELDALIASWHEMKEALKPFAELAPAFLGVIEGHINVGTRNQLPLLAFVRARAALQSARMAVEIKLEPGWLAKDMAKAAARIHPDDEQGEEPVGPK